MGSIAHEHFTELLQIPLQRLLKFQGKIAANFIKIYSQCKAVCKQLNVKYSHAVIQLYKIKTLYNSIVFIPSIGEGQGMWYE
jgi:hypothetical protein